MEQKGLFLSIDAGYAPRAPLEKRLVSGYTQ